MNTAVIIVLPTISISHKNIAKLGGLLNVCGIMTGNYVIGPYFFDGRVNSQAYFDLQNSLQP